MMIGVTVEQHWRKSGDVICLLRIRQLLKASGQNVNVERNDENNRGIVWWFRKYFVILRHKNK